MNTTKTGTKIALYCISPLVQGIASDLGSLNGFFPADAAELATRELLDDYILVLI